MRRLLAASLCLLAVTCEPSIRASAHTDGLGIDWTMAREYNMPGGFPCCGGQEEMGDCEGVTANNVWDNADGSIRLYSVRYKAFIVVPASRVTVDVARDPHTKQPLDQMGMYAAGWCGKPRNSGGYQMYEVTPADPDPEYHTYCAFRNAGGS